MKYGRPSNNTGLEGCKAEFIESRNMQHEKF